MKYYMTGTHSEVHFGDEIAATFSRKLDNGRTFHRVIEFELTPATLPWALENNIIEKGKTEKLDEPLINFDTLDDGEKTNEEIMQLERIIEKQIKNLKKTFTKYQKLVDED